MNNSTLFKSISIVATVTGFLLLIPLIAMQFTREVNWGIGDFVAAGILIFAAGMAYTLIARRVNAPWGKAIAGLFVLCILALVWAELAVGIVTR